MAKLTLYEYAILWHPTKAEIEDKDMSSLLIVPPKTVMAENNNTALMIAAMDIPELYKNQLGQIEISLRPF
jgi:hypothetical protein